MFYCHWLIKKLLLTNGLTELSQAERDIQTEQVESERSLVAPLETAASTGAHRNFVGRPQPLGDAQINGHGLVQDIRSSQNMLKLLAKQYCI